MLLRLTDLPNGIDGVKAIGRITRQDYEQVFEPLVDEARDDGRRLRLLYELGEGYEGFTAGAAWADALLGLKSIRLFAGCAVVSDVAWIADIVRLLGFLVPCPVEVFPNHERQKALAWLEGLPHGAAVKLHLIADVGVIVVEAQSALSAQDFDAIAQMADTYIAAHTSLNGLVIHASAFPGWTNFAGLLRHLRFVRNHHRQVHKIALAVDGTIAHIVPRIAAHFVKAEIKEFAYAALAEAITWASLPG